MDLEGFGDQNVVGLRICNSSAMAVKKFEGICSMSKTLSFAIAA